MIPSDGTEEDNARSRNKEMVRIVDNWPATPGGSMDDSQWKAMEQILTKKLSVIQGPPGTGKTYVSRVALETLVRNRRDGDPPIIIAAQTNHALDQLLVHVSKFDPLYVRLGGQTKNADVKKRALYEVRSKDRIPLLPGGLLGRSQHLLEIKAKELIETLRPLNNENGRDPFAPHTLEELGVITQAQAESLVRGSEQWVSSEAGVEQNPMLLWLNRSLVRFEIHYNEHNFGFTEDDDDLEFEQLSEEMAENGVTDNEDIENLLGPYVDIREDNTTAKSGSGAFYKEAERLLSTTKDLWKVREALRGPMYMIMQRRAKEVIRDKLRQNVKVYNHHVRDLKIGKWERDAVYLARANIIGMTTTGLSKYRPLIASLRPKIILIEEAAEAIEPPIAVACMPSLEHLILIGDHKQLKPHCNLQELEDEPYHFNVSMFERLVNNNMPFQTLLTQRRMDPEFRRLLAPIYPALRDHPSVQHRNPLDCGMGSVKSFFMNHDWPEHRDDSGSAYNDSEAHFVCGLYRHLICNAASPSSITMLTFYHGQRKRILKYLKEDPLTKSHYANVVTVDSYQGEENDIIILSLARSNDRGTIGFLEVDNRVCVALSRAKKAFFVVGNGQLMAQKSGLWYDVLSIMSSGPNRFGSKFPIVCKNHNARTLITYPRDWFELYGGCDRFCKEQLDCGHECPMKCHAFPHSAVRCQAHCSKLLVCGHECDKKCWEQCGCDCDEFGRMQDRDPWADGVKNLPPDQNFGKHEGTYTDGYRARQDNDRETPRIPKHQRTANRRAAETAKDTIRENGAFRNRSGQVRGNGDNNWVIYDGPVNTASNHNSKNSISSQKRMQNWSSYAEGGAVEDDMARIETDNKNHVTRKQEAQMKVRQQEEVHQSLLLPDLMDDLDISPGKNERVTNLPNGKQRVTRYHDPAFSEMGDKPANRLLNFEEK